jgi:hypothetical protein
VTLRRVEGLLRFRWADFQLEALRYCLPRSIRHVRDEFLQTLAETYERSLRDIREENWGYAHSLFQFVAVASRQLRVEELADRLAFDFEARPVPTFRPDWRPDPVDFLLSTCSTLLSVVKVEDGFRVIEFSLFSVKDFLTSDYLSASRDKGSRRYHIRLEPALAMVARACLGASLHLVENPEAMAPRNSLSLTMLPGTGWTMPDSESCQQLVYKKAYNVSSIQPNRIFQSGCRYTILNTPCTRKADQEVPYIMWPFMVSVPWPNS